MAGRTSRRRKRTYMVTPPTSDQEEPDRSSSRIVPDHLSRSACNAEDLAAFENEDSSDSDGEPPRKVLRRCLSHVETPGSAFPRSCYRSDPPTSFSDQAQTLSQLLAVYERHHSAVSEPPECIYFELNDFSIYRPDDSKREDERSRHAFELVTLDRLQNGRGFGDLLFDGTLSFGDEQRSVQGVLFRTMAVDGYGDASILDIISRICIQSPAAKRRKVWFRLGQPSREYTRFFEPFIWLAQFTKYFVDYLLESDRICLDHFRSRFKQWLCSRYRDDEIFSRWSSVCRLDDFRTSVTANVGYLWKECWSIDDETTGLCDHPVWGEVDPMQLSAIPKQANVETKTIVTPFVYQCFRRMYFHEHMECREVSDDESLALIVDRKSRLGLTPFGATEPPDTGMLTPRSMPDPGGDGIEVSEGDVVCVNPDPKGNWRNTSTTWYAYIQRIRTESDQTMLDILWLYEPRDTTLREAYYPFNNELFLSDNCACGRDALHISCVMGVVDVTWFATNPSTQAGLYVRQKFRTVHEEDTYDFVSLEKSDFECQCSHAVSLFEQCRRSFQIGDSVLVVERSNILEEKVLEPAQIVDFDLDKRRVILRRLRHKTEYDKSARPNELLLTRDLFYKGPSHIIRKCHIRSFPKGTSIPTPYDRNGIGDYYFVIGTPDDAEVDLSDSKVGSGSYVESLGPKQSYPPLESMWDPFASPSRRKLKGMGIFCGGGNFDRGLEEGGTVSFRYAVDWAEQALHSYRANTEDVRNVEFFLGSVNDYLAQAMDGSKLPNIAWPGDVGFISAGSPCPGFSLLQPYKQSPDSLRNASLVASVVSFVDFYCPEYCVLENVVSMTHGMGANKDENVFAQILAALVGLGYQVQQFYMPAWRFGSSQSRSRVFIVASAPGLKPLPAPHYTHAHPTASRYMRHNLGKSSNGLAFGVCRDEYTPFPHISAMQDTSDLPYLGDSQPQLCPSHPDHRTPFDESFDSRERIAAIPVRPGGMSLAKAARQNLLSGEPLKYFEGLGPIRQSIKSRTYSRLASSKLFPTVTTALRIADGVGGPTLHWHQDRTFTVMELRRAQGFLDNEVIVGTPTQQVVIIGNSVDRKAALVLGLAFQKSWSSTFRSAIMSDELDGNLSGHTYTGNEAMDTQTSVTGDAFEVESFQDEIGATNSTELSVTEKQSIWTNAGHAFQTIQRILRSRDGSKNAEIRKSLEVSRTAIASTEPAAHSETHESTVALPLHLYPNRGETMGERSAIPVSKSTKTEGRRIGYVLISRREQAINQTSTSIAQSRSVIYSRSM